MLRRRWLPFTLCLGLSTACFHQVVQTGSAPAGDGVEKQFVATWFWGLVPAQEIDVRKQCSRGVATVETEQSFVNGLVSVVTIGIYTPQHVKITCASATASLPAAGVGFTIPVGASAAESTDILRRAVESAEQTGAPVVLHF